MNGKSFTKWVAITLAIILIALVTYLIISQISEGMQTTDPKLQELKNAVRDLFKPGRTYKSALLQQHLHGRDILGETRLFTAKKSYTLNKFKVHMCLRDDRTGEYYDWQVLMHVYLHEISHVICPEIGHTPLFHSIFDDLMKEASDMDIYDMDANIPLDYCQYDHDGKKK